MAIAEFLEDFGSDPAHIIKRGELPAITPPHTIISGKEYSSSHKAISPEAEPRTVPLIRSSTR